MLCMILNNSTAVSAHDLYFSLSHEYTFNIRIDYYNEVSSCDMVGHVNGFSDTNIIIRYLYEREKSGSW